MSAYHGIVFALLITIAVLAVLAIIGVAVSCTIDPGADLMLAVVVTIAALVVTVLAVSLLHGYYESHRHHVPQPPCGIVELSNGNFAYNDQHNCSY